LSGRLKTQDPLFGGLTLIEETIMLGWALTFLVIALIAAVLGFGVVAGVAASVAKVIFVVFIVLFLISIVTGQRTPTP
jgi:uncharacterized membrane protein YtjA (UPF0391 family)